MLKYFIISSFIISLLLNLIYRIHGKRKKDSFYSTLIGLNLIGITLEIALSFFGNLLSSNVLLISLLYRFYSLYLMLAILFFTLNLFSICYGEIEEKRKYYRNIKNFTYYFFYIIAVLMLFSPIYLYENSAPTGMAIDIIYIYTAISMVSWLISNIKNIKTLKQRSFIPYGLYIIVFVTSILLGWNLQSLGIVASTQLYVFLIMLYTTPKKEEIFEEEKTELNSSDHRISELTMVTYDPASMVEEVIEDLKYRSQDNFVTFKFAKDKDVPLNVEGDLIVIRGIIKNLLDESVSHIQIGELKVKLDSIVKKDVCKLVLMIQNNGGGYQEEEFSQLFEENSNSVLSSTKHLVEQMGGKLVAINDSGIDTKFILAIEQGIK